MLLSLHPHQRLAVDRALSSPGRRWILNDETGLGKSPEFITIAREAAAQRVLVVTPSIVKLAWKARFDEWWPDHPEVGVISWGRGNNSLSKAEQEQRERAYVAPIQIISYNLLTELPDTTQYDVIGFDEAHRLVDPKVAWSKHAKQLVINNPNAAVLLLTATLMPNEPLDAYNPLDILCPGRFGSKNKFASRYCNYDVRKWIDQDGEEFTAREFFGVNEAHAAELQTRLAAMSSRTTKAEVAHLLPTFDVRSLVITTEKLPAIKEWVDDAAREAKFVAVSVYYREFAERIATALRSKHNVLHLDGSCPADKRAKLLDEMLSSTYGGVVVTTIDSVGEGIDLSFCTMALMAELPFTPKAAEQWLGRFPRLSGKAPTTQFVLVQEGTQDELRAAMLLEKVEAINTAMKAGVTSQKIESALKTDDTNWQERFSALAANMPEEDGYGL